MKSAYRHRSGAHRAMNAFSRLRCMSVQGVGATARGGRPGMRAGVAVAAQAVETPAPMTGASTTNVAEAQVNSVRKASSVSANAAEEPSEQPRQLLPGDLDTMHGFVEGESVAFWRAWRLDDAAAGSSGSGSGGGGNGGGLSMLRDRLATNLSSDPVTAAQYFSYHAVRTSFFMLNAYAGLFYADRARQGAGDAMPNGMSTSSVQSALPSLGYNLGEVSAMYLQDFENIRRGEYKLPWDASVRHRQSNPLFIANKVRNFVGEAARTLQRRVNQQSEDVWMKSSLYPEYYLNTWHYQSDGWLSSASADVYETSTETLFLGRQDAMQRQTMLPISKYVRQMRAEDKLASDMSLLEVGAGTGRALTFIVDNFPDMRYTCSELSPFYLQKARENMDYYSRFKGRDAKKPQVSFMQAAAENLPVDDESQDIVVNIYMFHELELGVLRQVAREMGRVLKPGGLLVFTDSIQLGDRPMLDANLGNFKKFNEPNYIEYINLDVGKLFMDEAGLVPDTKEVGSSTKVLSFRKPS